MPWNNLDGLRIKFGNEQAERSLGGVSNTDGNDTVVTINFTSADLAAFGTEKIIGEGIVIPKNAVIRDSTLHVLTAFTSGGSATLTLGLIDDDRTTAYDADGIDATIAVAALTAGARIANDGAAVGVRINNSTGLMITALVGTANFTAGAAQLTLRYFIPA